MQQIVSRKVLCQGAIASLDSVANDARLRVEIEAISSFAVDEEGDTAGLKLAGTEADAQAVQLSLLRGVDADLAARLPAPNDPVLFACLSAQHSLVHVAAEGPLRILALKVEEWRQPLRHVPVLLPEPYITRLII